MENNSFFFVNVCRCLVCAVYFVIVPIGYTLLVSRMNVKLCSVHISAWNCKINVGVATEFKMTDTLSKCITNIKQNFKKLIEWQCFFKAHKTLIK